MEKLKKIKERFNKRLTGWDVMMISGAILFVIMFIIALLEWF